MAAARIPVALDSRLQELFELPSEQRDRELAALCVEHPEYATSIRERSERARSILAELEAVPGPPEFPTRVGRFEILRLLGEGGMGSVYLARQHAPIDRLVALKLIKAGMDTKRILMRFETERQTLALMNHPGIARILDAGATNEGRPWFAMEYVDGLPITRYCNEKRAGVRERLELFRAVCAAVQHAHTKGVIHRDLKPSNVLVGGDEGRPRPKIIDFGLARAVDIAQDEGSLLTREGLVLGTPDYMSPEQAGGASHEIDTRTDVYALGVLLYELLAGALPFDRSALGSAGCADVRRVIRELDPQKPSTRISESDDDVATLRSVARPTLERTLRGDLDWITLKSLAKERERRYQSAGELSDDLGRYLRDEPVLARPPSAAYRLRKFAKRYRIQVGAACLLFVSLVAGIIGTGYGLVEANAQRERAEGRESDLRAANDRLARSLADFDLLATATKLERAIASAAQIFPAWPEKLDEIQAWLAETGGPLSKQAPVVAAALARLRESAGPWTEAQQQSDRASHPLRAKLDERIDHRARHQAGHPLAESMNRSYTPAALEKHLAELDETISGLRARVETRRSFEIEDKTMQFLHDTLQALSTKLGAFCDPENGLLADVERRARWASTIREASITLRDAEWAAAIEAIHASDGVTASKAYQGLEISPQIGLVPVGIDPKTKLWEFAHLRSSEGGIDVPERDVAQSQLCQSASSGIVFVLLPPGEARIGAQADDPGGAQYDARATDVEQPVHQHALSAFFLAKHETTQAQWLRLARDNPSIYAAGTRPKLGLAKVTSRNPAEGMTWHDARRVLGEHGLTLPTEAQWEYACRAGTTTPWHTGDAPASLRGFANFADRSSLRHFPNWQASKDHDDGHVLHAPVGSYAPNAFGLHDMHGNVDEWCLDPQLSYKCGLRKGDGFRLGVADVRAVRGGSYADQPATLRASHRQAYRTDQRSPSLGTRAARALRD